MDWSSHRRGFALCFALALAVRLLYLGGLLPVLETRQTPIYGDATMYWASAGVLAGDRVDPSTVSRLDRPMVAGWDRDLTWRFVQERGPAYVLMLAGSLALFGDDPRPVRALQALLGAAACALVFGLARELAGARAGWVAGVLAAVHPTLVLFTGRLLTETSSAFLLALGLFALVRARRARPPAWLAVSGLAIAASALSRATLLSVVPFAIAAAVAGGPRRPRDLAVLAAALLGPLAVWYAIATAGGGAPVAGGTGLRVLAAVAETATLPRYRGWRTDDFDLSDLLLGERPGGWAEVLADDPLYPIPAVANLVFVHQWFLDNLWREVPTWLHGLQRAVFVLALGGLGAALLRWRAMSPVLLPCVPLAIVSVKWIEIRPNLPFLQVLLVLVGVFVAWVLDLVARAASPRRAALGLAAALAGSGAVLAASRLPVAALLLPRLDPAALGHLGDAAIAAVALGLAGLLYALAKGPLGRGRAAVASLVPSGLFVAGFASYALVGSLPRWHGFEIDLAKPGRELTQTIELGEPLAADRIDEVLWLVDLATDADWPPIAVGLGGEKLSSARYAWRRLFCAGGVPAGSRAEAVRRRSYCDVYVRGLSEFTGAYTRSPQWWGIAMAPALVAGRETLTLRLAPTRRTATGDPLELAVGGAIATGRPDRYDGPSLDALDSGAATSLYRWHVANDWRLWQARPLASRRTRSRLALAPTGEPARDRRLASWLEEGAASANVRLLVHYRDGDWVAY